MLNEEFLNAQISAPVKKLLIPQNLSSFLQDQNEELDKAYEKMVKELGLESGECENENIELPPEAWSYNKIELNVQEKEEKKQKLNFLFEKYSSESGRSKGNMLSLN